MFKFAEVIKSEQVERIHQASLEILENIGLIVHNQQACEMFKRHGCQIESSSQLVRFPPAVVEEYRALIPSKFTFHGRDPRYDRTIPGDGPLVVTGSSAPNLIDPVTRCERRSTSADIANIAHLINQLPGYDVFSISTLADDAPAGHFTLARLYPALKNCLKPVRSTATDREDAENMLELAYLIAGSEEAYRERPFVTHHFCPIVSPLTMDVASTEMVMFFAEKGLPVYGSVVPNAGLSSPMSMAGTLAQGNAEFLASSILLQMVRVRTPLIYSTLPTVADLRTGAYASGGIECGLLHMAFAQMARFYQVPYGGYIGLSNAKVNDAQSGYETGLSSLAGVLAGMDMLNMGGLLDALKAFDFAKAVIDDEIALMLKRVVRGIQFSEEDLALDVISEVGPGGMFMVHDHTVSHMRSIAVTPKISDRETRQVWESKNSLDSQARAMRRVREILGRDNPVVFSMEVEQRIRARFENLVEGETYLPAGL
jgi:trimethylamine---corrinoid protein Co-methyltransferase